MITNQNTPQYDAGYEPVARASQAEGELSASKQVDAPRDKKWPLGLRFIFILGLSGLLWAGIFILIGMLFF